MVNLIDVCIFYNHPNKRVMVISNDVRSEESARGEAGCGGNEDVDMDVWNHRAGQNKEQTN